MMASRFRVPCFATLFFASVACADWNVQLRHELPQRKPAWEHTQRMTRDVGYSPVAAGDLVFAGCEHNGALLALDRKTGKERWRFYTSAPIRHAVAATDTHVFVGSDDGLLYCLDHAGKLHWKLRGGPSDRLVIGHERMISAWPISTRPLLADGILYFVAGYWPVDGIYIHAVNATTGKKIWSNNAAEFRPNRTITLIDGKLMIDGDNGSAVVDARRGTVLNEKRIKPPPLERPQVSGINGNMTAWSQAGDFLAVGSTAGVFGLSNQARKTVAKEDVPPPKFPPLDTTIAEDVIRSVRIDGGYCVVVGLKDGALVEGVLRKSKMHVVAIDANAERVEQLRQKFDGRGLFDDHRLTVLFVKDLGTLNLPPYFASLIVSEADDALTDGALNALRPHGGAILKYKQPRRELIRFEASPEDSGDWTHEFCDAANSLASVDKLVKAPLGLLWYGGEAADARFYFDGNVDHQSGHGLNPQPVPAQVVEGRMILQGPGLLAAVDIYTGRILWESPLPTMYTFGGSGGGLGIHSKKHPRPWEHAAAMDFDVKPTERCRASGFDMVSLPDGIYVAAGEKLIRFDLASGTRVGEFPVPVEGDLRWGSVRAVGDTLVATLFHPHDLAVAHAGHDGNGGDWASDRMPMSHLVAVDRTSGQQLWSRKASWGFLNRSGICIGDGKVFCVDLITEKVYNKFNEAKRRFPDASPTLYALDLKTGAEVWKYPLDVYVQNIVYSERHDLLLAPCRNLKEWQDGKWVDLSIDIRRGTRNKNAAGKMRALRGDSGDVAWEVAEAAYHSPHIVMGDLVIDRWGRSYDVLTGKRHLRTSPLTGQPEMWSFRKGGCNHLVACENMVTWRCAYYDLKKYGGVKNLVGMDAGCSPTLLPAGGILNVANFGTHHKRNRMTAMALVHRPENDLLTAFATTREKFPDPKAPDWMKRVGFNFGTTGDHFGANDTLWLQVSQRKRGNVSYQPKEVRWFNLGTSLNGSPVASSGILGATEISIPTTQSGKTSNNATKRYTVRLHFGEPSENKPGQRVFSVALEGTTVLEDFDIANKTSGGSQPIVREFTNIEVRGRLDIVLAPHRGQTLLSGVEIILEQ